MKKGCLIAGALIFVVASIGLGAYFYKKSVKPAVEFEVSNPFVTDIIKKTVATGSIIPRKEVNIKPQVSGIVDRLYVEPGLKVSKGDKLARIKLIPSPVNINTAESSVELARIRYKEAQRELKRQREVNDKNLDVETARVNYENAKQEEERQRALFDDGIISEQDYKQFVLERDVTQTAYENAQITSSNSIRQFESDLDIRKQELEAAIDNLQLLREGASRNSKQVSNIVVSTVDGMILDIPVEEGSSVIERNNFNEGTSIATVADMNSLIFEGKVDESDVGKLKEGMNLELTVGAIEDEKFDAVLEYISPKGIEEEGTVKFIVKAAIKPSEDIFLRAGYSASGDIILDKVEQVMAVKERDIIFRNDSAFVDVETGDQQFKNQLVEVGLSDGINIQVMNGIDTTTSIKVIKGVVE